MAGIYFFGGLRQSFNRFQTVSGNQTAERAHRNNAGQQNQSGGEKNNPDVVFGNISIPSQRQKNFRPFAFGGNNF